MSTSSVSYEQEQRHALARQGAAERLQRAGLADRSAWALASAGYDVIDIVPLGQVGLPFDEHLARISNDLEGRG